MAVEIILVKESEIKFKFGGTETVRAYDVHCDDCGCIYPNVTKSMAEWAVDKHVCGESLSAIYTYERVETG